MQPLIPTLTFEQLRQAKKYASKSLESLEISLSSSTTGNHVAQLFGYRDWNIASALTKTNESPDMKNGPESEDSNNVNHLVPLHKISEVTRSLFMQVVSECASSIRLAHLNNIASVVDNTGMVDKMFGSAVVLTYQRRGEKATLTDFVKALEDTPSPSSMSSVKEDIMFVFSNKDPNLTINYYGMLIKSVKDMGIAPKVSSQYDLRSLGKIKRLHLMEDKLDELGYPQLKMACKAIVGSNGEGTELRYSIREDLMKEREGIWHTTWIPHKLAILQNEAIFTKVADDFGFDATNFINSLYDDIRNTENFLSSKKVTPMKNIDRIQSIFEDIQEIELSSQAMHDYVNTLSRDDYSLLATAYDLGRQGWERNYYDTHEYQAFVEDMESDGYKVTQEAADSKFLFQSKKQEQFDSLYQYMFNDAVQHNGAYNHNWLSQKTNLISATNSGARMMQELA